MPLATVSALYVYPIKSCGGVPLERGRIGRRGFLHDREWMIVDRDYRFLSQRSLPRMALVRPALTPGGLQVEAPDMPPLNVNGDESRSRLTVEVWGDRCEAEDAGPDAARWFSEFLDVPCSLVRMADRNVRRVDPDFAVRPEDEVGFADGYPFLLLSEGSLDDLNTRLGEPLAMDRFRPNVVVAGCAPYAEDGWTRFRIGAVPFAAAKPCARCSVTTVDQSSGEPGKEPLRTLATYRQRGGKVYFGQNLVHLAQGEIAVGEAVRTE
jgi:uncharacterized protein